MAQRSARSHRSRAALADEREWGDVGALVARHRLLLGGMTAFAVAFAYVAANAVWYQPHAHGGAFFSTRPLAGGTGAATSGQAGVEPAETIIRLQRSDEDAVAVVPVPASRSTGFEDAAVLPVAVGEPPKPADPVVQDVQRVLAELNLYSGSVDGLTGPQTRRAIEAYRKMVGLPVTGDIDEMLLTQLGTIRTLVPARSPVPGTDMIATSSAMPSRDPMVVKIQAGLKAFGNDGIELDGVVGARTRSAVREFQSLFGLDETGEPDEALYAKMREIGLTD